MKRSSDIASLGRSSRTTLVSTVKPKCRQTARVQFLVLLGMLVFAPFAHTQTSYWLANPGSSDWDTASNWNGGLPSSTGTAQFDNSTIASLTFSGTSTSVGEIYFAPDAVLYTFTLGTGDFLTINGVGGTSIFNNSPWVQTFNVQGTLIIESGTIQASTAVVAITNNNGGLTQFSNSSSAGSATIVDQNGTSSHASATLFTNSSSAGSASITNTGPFATVQFQGTATAGNATIVNSTSNGQTEFFFSSSAGNATITANSGGLIVFADTSTGGQAQIITNAGGNFYNLESIGLSVGSISGAGTYNLGSQALTVGSNNLSTTVSGTMEDGPSGTGASLIKVGTGTLTLTGANTYSGGTTISGGTLQLGDGTNNGTAGTGPITDNRILILDFNGSTTIGNTIGGIGLVLLNAGTAALTGTNTYSGSTAINGGDLQVSADTNLGASTGTLTIRGGTLEATATFTTNRIITVDSGTFDIDSGAMLTIGTSGFLSGAGLTKTGAGTLVLAGDDGGNTGNITISAGTLAAGSTGAFSGLNNLTVTGTLDLNGFSNTVGAVTGSGAITNNGAAAATLTVKNGMTFTGNITDGTSASLGLQLGGISTLSGDNTYGGTTTLNVGATLRAASATALSPSSGYTLNSGSTLDLQGFNNSIASLSGSGTVTTSAGPAVLTVLNALGSTNTTFSGNLVDGSNSSQLGLTVQGNGTLTLSGNNTYSGATSVGGNLVAASTTALSPNSAFTVDGLVNLNGFSNTIASLSGTGGVAVLSGGSATLTVGDANTTTFSGALTDLASSGSGALSLIKVGTGTLTLSGTNTYSGSTTVDGGVLNFTGTLTNASTLNSSVRVNSGGTLAGNGTIKEAVIISSGGILAPGIPSPVTIGTLTVGSLTLNSGSILNYQLGVPNLVGGTANDLIQVNGNLTLSGATLNIANIGGFGEGVYRLINYTGSLSLTNNGIGFGTLPNGITASELLLQTSQAGQINLLFSATGFTDQFWDGSTTTADGTIHGGSGTWNNVTTNWTNMDATVNASWNKRFAIFEGTAGTVTLGDNIQFNGAEFMTTGYTISALGAQTLMATAGTFIRVDPNVTATIAAPIVDASGVHADVTKTDAGTLILTGTNTYSGGTTISGGVLQLGNGGASGSIVGDVVDNGIFAIDRSDAFTFGGNISGKTGAFEQLGTGTTTLTGSSTYFGTTMVSSGILQAGSVNVFSPSSQFSVSSGATLDLNGFSNTIGSLTGNGSVINSAKLTLAALTFGGDNTNDVFSGVIGQAGGGTLSLTKVGLGTEVLTGANLYTGGTTISGGTLQLGNGGTTGSIIGKVTDNAVFAIDRSDTYAFAGVISGTGSVKQLGKGTIIFTGNDTYTGGTTISAGTLQIGDGGTAGSIVGKVTDEGIFAFDRSDAYTFDGTIKGRGSIEQSGAGALTLSGANSYSGGTELDSGTLIVDNASALGTGDVMVKGGILTADPQPINVQGNYFQGPNGTLQLTIAGANPGQYDFLNVTGNASLGGTLKLINQNFTPQVGDTLILVKAGGSIANKFATFVDPFTTRPGLNTIDLVYSLNTVDLEFLNIVPPTSPTPPPPKIITINFPTFGQNPNEVAAGELLNAVELNPRFGNLLNFFLSQPFGNLPGDLALIGPESLTSFYEISFSSANLQRLNLENRLDEIRFTGGTFNTEAAGGTVGLQKGAPDGKTGKNPVEPVLQPVVKPLFDLWASGYGDFVHVDSDFNARGYRFTNSGFDLGFDYRFLDHFAVGVMGNYAYTWTDLRPGTITVNSGRGGLYASYFNGNFYVDAGVYGGYNTYDTNRHALFGNAIGNTDGEEWSGFLTTGYDFHTRKNLTIGPVASLQYTNVYVTGFTEQGSLLPMSIHSASEESLRTDLGIRATYQWQVGRTAIEPYVKAEWEHEFKYSALPVTASLAQFPGPDETFHGPAEGQDSAVVSAGVSVQWTTAVSTFVGYDGQLGRNRYNSNAVNGGVRVSW